MTDVQDPQVRIVIKTSDPQQAGEIERDLNELGAAEIEVDKPDNPGIAPLVIVIGALLVVGAVSDLIHRERRRRQCQQIIDASGDEVQIKTNCDRKDGSIIIVSKEGQKVEVRDVPDGVDLNGLVEAGLKLGADGVKAAAKAIGANASDA